MNKVNYQKILDGIISNLQKTNTVPTLLLHVCCAPCSSYCLEYLSQYFKITVFFYNPNITEAEEYEKRKSAQIAFLTAYNEKLSEEDKATVEAAVKEAKDELASDDNDRIVKATEKLSNDVQGVFAKLYQQAQGAANANEGAQGGSDDDTEFHQN